VDVRGTAILVELMDGTGDIPGGGGHTNTIPAGAACPQHSL
jgi:hypothetical protein